MNAPASINTHGWSVGRCSLWPRRALFQFTLASLLTFGLCSAAPITNVLPFALDLTPYYNLRFVTAKGTNSTFQTFHGRQMIDSLPFNIDGECVVYGRSQAERSQDQDGVFPDEVTSIEIGRSFAELHLIHTVWWREYHGCPLAIIRLHYADGETFAFQLRYCVHVLGIRLPSEEREILADPNSKLVWRSPETGIGYTRLVKTVLQNPYPDKKVDSMDIISDRSRASYALIAATVAADDPQRALSAALPLNDPERQFDGVLKLRVLEKETGQPIAGADVTPNIAVDDLDLVVDPLVTSQSGEVILRYPLDRTSFVGVEVNKPGWEVKTAFWESGDIPDAITYRLAIKAPGQ